MDPEFLKKVQRAGWAIERVTQDGAIAKCRADGCGMKALLSATARVPKVDPTDHKNRFDRPLASYDELRRLLRDRREDLGLTIREVEEVSGATTDHIAKSEKEDPARKPNFDLVLEWATTLGFEIILRPAHMPAYSLRTIADTRDKVESRKRRFSNEAKRRSQSEGQGRDGRTPR